MEESAIAQIIIDSFKSSKKMYFWFFVRVLTTAGPLVATYVFSLGVKALETGRTQDYTIQIFSLYLVIILIETTIRILAKTRIVIQLEYVVIDAQKRLIAAANPPESIRKETVQSIRNLTQSLRNFVEYMKDSGLNGATAFVSVPVILYFIEKKVFFLEMLLIIIYLIVTKIFTRIYEKKYENYNKSREYYFAKLIVDNDVEEKAEYIRDNIKDVNDVVLYGWVSLQDLFAIFQFLIIVVIVMDFFAGTKQISDLILIVGYTKESQGFLNSITSTVEALMQVEAGVERVSVVSKKGREEISLA